MRLPLDERRAARASRRAEETIRSEREWRDERMALRLKEQAEARKWSNF
jgi:hypothetical protein